MGTNTLFRGWVFSCVAVVVGCSADPAPRQDEAQNEAIESTTAALAAGGIQSDFEDGTLQGWGPFGSPTLTNTTEAAFSGTHSLKTTNRTATFMGPSISLTGQLTAGATYRASVAVRMAPGESPSTLHITVMRTLTDGTNAFDSVATNTNVTADAWVNLSGNYSFSTPVNGLMMYVESSSATASYYIDAFSLTQSTPAPIASDFEDGTPQGWFAFGSPTVVNSTDVAFAGTHSLKTTNRTASFMGPGMNLQGLLTKGATYQITLSARLVAGEAASTLQPTVMRTPTGGSAAFDSVASASVTDQAWVTITGIYSFATDNSGLIFYVQSTSGTSSFYIDSVTITQVAAPPGPPANTTGAASTFESNTLEGWKARTGGETVAVTNADAHGGSFSLLASNRSFTFQGPAFDVTNVMFNGSRYVVSVWAKLAPGQSPTQLRVSLDRKLGTATETFHIVVGNTTVTSDAWVHLQATYDQALANSSLVLYVESASGTQPFYIDDFSITYVPPAVAERDIPSVFQTLAPFFPVGTAVLPADIQGEPAVLLAKHFNSMTSGNDMKWDATEPTEGHFTFTQADAEVAFAKANGMRVRGHTLVWHNQTPAWVFNDASGNPMTPTPENKALLIQRMQNHIQAVMTHFGGDVATWDVVNEPIDPAQPDGYRRSPWFNIIGPEYIEIALNAARAASPTAKLYINDFDTTNPAHRDPLLAVVRDLKGRGVPLDGVGHQMHNNIEYPPVQTVIDAVNLFATTGVEQSVTEMDVSIYSFSGANATPFTSYTDIPASRHTQVGYSYLGYIQALKQLQGKIVSLTIWGTSDDKSWLTSSSKVDAPLLFDTSLKKKPAYWALVDPLQLPGADLSAAMTAVPSGVAAGQAVTYTVTITNNADHDTQSYQPSNDDLPAANPTMTMAVPSHTGFQSLAAPAGWTCTTPGAGASGPISCTASSLAVGASAQFALTVAVNDCSTPDATGITASASVTSATADPNPAPNNTASASAQVSNPPPVITANGALDTTVECHTAYADPGATAADDCEGPVAVSTASNVDVNTVGSYAVSYGAIDRAGGQAAPVVRTVHVADTTAPVVTLVGPAALAAECAVPFIDPGAVASDSCAGPLPVTATGAVDASTVGSYPLAYTATDPSGNSAGAARVVTVADATAPVVALNGPGAMTIECASAFHDPGAAASDSCAGPLPVTATGAVDVHTVGSYPLGYAAVDPSGNVGSAARVVTVADSTAPRMDVIDLTILDEDVTVVLDDQNLTVNGRVHRRASCGVVFIDGHEIIYDGTSVRVHGRVIPADGRVLVLLPANHKYRTFKVSDLVDGAADGCDASVGTGAVQITTVTSDEADNGKHDGNTDHDVVIAGDCRSVQLRLEREGGGNGRVYTVGLRVKDASGNGTSQSVKVMIPPDEDRAVAVDDGPVYTVTSACR
jgi:endo-1,4-beta-xylanase